MHLFGLRESLTMILDEEGPAGRLGTSPAAGAAVWAAVEAWGQGSDIALTWSTRIDRGRSVTAARVGNGGAGALRRWCETEAGVTLGIGLGMAMPGEPAYDDYLRVAHMGHVNAHMVLGMLATMEAGMRVCAIPHGKGALEAACAVVAQA